jgi:Zn-dependent metalloprotease
MSVDRPADPQGSARRVCWADRYGAGLLANFPDQALRSMKAPGTAYDNNLMGKDPQPADMAHYVHTAQDNGGVHTNSGIPNRAFFLVATALGGNAWEKAGQIWYDTIRDKSLNASANFAGRTVVRSPMPGTAMAATASSRRRSATPGARSA